MLHFTLECSGIGVGVPSVLDRRNGIIYDVQNIKSWKEVPLKKILENKFGVPVYLDNDANCFAIGEKLFGNGKKLQNFVGITIGTGIGGGIINRGKLIADANCGSGEFGEIYYLDGRIEDYCSSQFFDNKIGISGAELFKRAEANDEYALDVFKQFGRHLGKALKIIMFAIDPEAVIIGGSISSAKKYFYASMSEELKIFTYHKSLENFEVIFSDITDDTQIFGSAAIYLSVID